MNRQRGRDGGRRSDRRRPGDGRGRSNRRGRRDCRRWSDRGRRSNGRGRRYGWRGLHVQRGLVAVRLRRLRRLLRRWCQDWTRCVELGGKIPRAEHPHHRQGQDDSDIILFHIEWIKYSVDSTGLTPTPAKWFITSQPNAPLLSQPWGITRERKTIPKPPPPQLVRSAIVVEIQPK